MEKLPNRKHPRLDEFDYSADGAYFITICTHNRKCTLSRVVGAIHESPEIELTDYGKITDETIRNIPERYKATVDRYVIMPNHIHLIIIITNDEELRAIRESPLRYDAQCNDYVIARNPEGVTWQSPASIHRYNVQ